MAQGFVLNSATTNVAKAIQTQNAKPVCEYALSLPFSQAQKESQLTLFV